MTSMTWREFVERANKSFEERGISTDTQLETIDWRRDAFGGDSVPDVYVQIDAPTGRIFIGED